MIIIPERRVHFAFDPGAEPVERAADGDTVIFRTQDCYCGQILHDGFDFEKIDMERNNPATGPLFVEGAEPGDILGIDILDIEIADDGCMTARAGTGTYDIQGTHCRRFPIENGMIRFDRGISVPARPMVGVMGTAPERPLSTQLPGPHGGNLDIKDLGVGSTLYLPVASPGGLLSVGDIHAVQGDGETVICALEVAGSVTLRVRVLKGRADIPAPFLVTESHYISLAADPSLDRASVSAANRMRRFVADHSDLDDTQAAMLLSIAGDLRITQIVNPAKGCAMQFPIGLAGERFQP